MRHQKTYDNIYSKLYNSANYEMPNMNVTNTPQQKKYPFHKRTLSYSKVNKKLQCKEHNRNFYKYCILCKDDLCPQCYNNYHFIHDILNYEEISLNENQIKLVKTKYNEYLKAYSHLLVKIKEWQNCFNNAVLEFEEYMKNNIIVINDMINNYDINNLNYNTIIEYRIIYSLLLENNEDNRSNQKMIKLMESYKNLKSYDNYHYIDHNENYSSISNEVISLLNNTINKGNFVQKGNNIIKFLFNNFHLLSNKIKCNKKINKVFHKIGEKYIKSNSNSDKEDNMYVKRGGMKNNLNKSTNNILESTKNFNKILSNNIYEKKKPFDKNRNGEIFLEKEEIPIFNKNSYMPPKEDFEDINSLNNSKQLTQKKWNNLYITKTYKNNNTNYKYNNHPDSSIFLKTEEKPNYFSARGNHPLWKSTNYFQTINSDILNDNEDIDEFDDINIDLNYKNENNKNSSLNKRPIIFNNNINNFNSINNINSKNNYINNYNINRIYTDRDKKCKIYTHKKFSTSLVEIKNMNLLNKSQLDKNNEGIFNTIDLNNYDTYTAYNIPSMNDSKNPSSYREKKKNTKTKRSSENQKINNSLNIKKVKEFQIDINKDINIGFELGNSECKIGIFNQSSNCVELWVPYEGGQNIGIPTLISLKDKNDNIIIGKSAEELKINNPAYTFFNFIKFIGKNYDEIEGKKELWPYKIYNNEKSKKPYAKGYSNEHKNKIYNFEDLLSLYLRKVFELLFSKFKFKNDRNNTLIKINIIVTVPNNFNYIQRKVIEKIFLTQLFPKSAINNNNISNYYSEDNKNNINNKPQLYTYGKYNIQIKNIKIENSSNIGYLYLFQKQIENNNNKLSKNVILIHIDGGSVNISFISALINNDLPEKENKDNEVFINKYEIKGIRGTTFGEEDFTDNFINSCLSDFTEKIRDGCLKTPSTLAKLRKSCETAKKYFYKTNKTEINIQKLYGNIELKMALNKSDYERDCNGQFQIINELIKDLFIKSNISEKEIDDIIFIGNTTNVNIIKQKISKIFKSKNNELFNKLANNKYFENDKNNIDFINEDYISIGASLQCFNLYSNKLNKFKYNEVTPISFGIEGLDKKMEFIIEKGCTVPTQVNKYVKIVKPKGEFISINIYEGDEKYVNNNRLMSSAKINIKNFKNEKNGKDYIEILIQFIINTNNDLNVFILDTKTLRKKFECIINIDVVQDNSVLTNTK